MEASCTRTLGAPAQARATYRIKPQTATVLSLPVWREMTLADKTWIDPILAAEDSLSSDGCFGTPYLWGASFRQTVARVENRVLMHYNTPTPFFAFPAGDGSLRPALQAMAGRSAAMEVPLVIKGVTEVQREKLEEALPGAFRFEESEKSFDYVYAAEALVTLSGKKLHKKRNHCNRFEQEHADWRFEPLERRHIPHCLALLDSWAELQEEPSNSSTDAERVAILRAFRDYEALGLEGGMLFVGQCPVAFTVGERVGQNGFDVHFEKADRTVNGAYAMVNREFARLLRNQYPLLQWINREEDLGIENLRKAKESYYPAILLKKYIAREAAE